MDKHEFENRFRTMQVIWVALMSGVALFAVVVFSLLTVAGLAFGVLEPRILHLAAPALVVLMFLGLAIGRRLEAAIPRDLTPELGLQRYQAARIVALAMCEGPGLVAIVFSMLSDQPLWALAGGAACGWFMFLGRPRRSEAERYARRGG
ncbi:MAG: hypothetical protein P8170_02940 [Gemmatimonadota bacterium]|jgi:F0F1-type ATP synthase membrane subunit c/vacuolar-type H+-ATPase subunit K